MSRLGRLSPARVHEDSMTAAWRTKCPTAALLALIMAIALGDDAARAEPVKLAASPNPVVLPFGTTTGTTTLTYDSGDGTQARIRLVRDGQDLGQIHAATTSKGTLKHTVVVGHTYVFRLIAFSENRGSSLSRTVAETTVKAMQGRFNGCEGPCIRRVLSQALGTYAELLVDTLVPTSLIVSVSEKAPRADGTFEKVSWAGFSLAPSREHFVRPTGLAPDTRHFYIVIAKDARGATHRRVGSFVTQMRRATIHFEEIKLFDDSDSTGAGELTFAFFAGKPGEPSFMEAVRPADGWKSGSTYFPNRTLRIDDAPDEIPVLVVGRDDDTSPVEVQSCGTKMLVVPADRDAVWRLHPRTRLGVRLGAPCARGRAARTRSGRELRREVRVADDQKELRHARRTRLQGRRLRRSGTRRRRVPQPLTEREEP